MGVGNDDPQQILYGRIGQRKHEQIQLGDLDPEREERLLHAYLRALLLLSNGLREYKRIELKEVISKASEKSSDRDPEDFTGLMAMAVIEQLQRDQHIQLLDDGAGLHYRPTEEGAKVLKMWDLRALSRMQL